MNLLIVLIIVIVLVGGGGYWGGWQNGFPGGNFGYGGGLVGIILILIVLRLLGVL